MAFDARHRYIISKVKEVFEIEDISVESFLSSVIPIINIFFRGEGSNKLLVACRWHGDGTEDESTSHDDDSKSHASGDYDGYPFIILTKEFSSHFMYFTHFFLKKITVTFSKLISIFSLLLLLQDMNMMTMQQKRHHQVKTSKNSRRRRPPNCQLWQWINQSPLNVFISFALAIQLKLPLWNKISKLN